MTAAKKKAGRAGRKPVRDDERYVTLQVTLSPSDVAILDKWAKADGPGMRSMRVRMAIRYANTAGIFDDERVFARAARAPSGGDAESMSLNDAVAKHVPQIIHRIATELMKKEG